MSSPHNMRTGFALGSSPENYFPETFFIIYLILAAMLRRCGFKDCVLYSKHCKRVFDQEMFDAGVIFNLHSEYGVGKSLRPLIYELLLTTGIDPVKNGYNIFFREIIRLTPEVVNIIRSNDPSLETIWTMKYAMETEPIIDDISNERIFRMADLLYEIPSDDDISESEESEGSEGSEKSEGSEGSGRSETYISDNEDMFDLSDRSEEENPDNTENTDNTDTESEKSSDTYTSGSDDITCYCIFCHEFRKYYGPYKNQNVADMINSVLVDIADEIKSNL